jgi:UDP-N-acetylmuramoyl-tripeptide--D-alanyl-D-alanine ligase
MRIIPKLPITIKEISCITNSSTTNDDAIGAITTNSKEVYPGDLFVAIKGESLNGEDFAEEAKRKGAYVLSALYDYADFKVLDTLETLVKIASYYKTKLKKLTSTVAITGSTGKTTTKNILAKMLSPHKKTHCTEGNYNNFLGLSHTIFNAPVDTEILVAEIGMNHLGEIGVLSKALKPDVSVITNIGSAHIGNLGNRELIAKAKLEIVNGMKNPKVLVPYEEALFSDITGRYTYSIESENANSFINPKSTTSFGSLFDIHTESFDIYDAKTSLPGNHILKSIAMSISVMELLKLTSNEIKASLPMLDEECIRAKFINKGKITVYDDTYSSSPEAVIAMLKMLSLYDTPQKSCMLGDMLELGNDTERLHKIIGEAVVENGFQKLFAFGLYAPFIADGAKNAGMTNENIFINTNIDAPEITANQIIQNTEYGELVLFKASHAIHAERIYNFL